jgi:hypothetical protein
LAEGASIQLALAVGALKAITGILTVTIIGALGLSFLTLTGEVITNILNCQYSVPVAEVAHDPMGLLIIRVGNVDSASGGSRQEEAGRRRLHREKHIQPYSCILAAYTAVLSVSYTDN